MASDCCMCIKENRLNETRNIKEISRRKKDFKNGN